jgi:hypothetical protein
MQLTAALSLQIEFKVQNFIILFYAKDLTLVFGVSTFKAVDT